jgi:hypothetical protein
MVHLSNIKIEAIMAKNYKEVSYFSTRPDIVKLFEDLEAFHNWCRSELCEFNEGHLYNRESWQWRNFDKSRRPKKPFTGERKPYLGKNPRYNSNDRIPS